MRVLAEKLRGEQGFALIITLLVTAIIVSLLGEIVFSVHMDTTAAAGYIDYENAGIMAGDGLPVAVAFSREINEAGYTYLGEDKGVRSLKNERGELNVRLFDESGRLSLNAIVFKNGEINQDYYDMYIRLLGELGLPASLAGSLADWIDSDDSARKDGGENNDYYLRLSAPYASKGAPLSTVEELYLVKGYGVDEVKALREFVTVKTNGKVNINTAPGPVLRALSPEITDEMARDVISYRAGTPFRNTADIRKVSGFEQLGFNLQNRIVVKSRIFRALITARAGRSRSTAEAVFENSDKESTTYYYRQR
ncbi:MAG: type II secretion system minor pseudopilin GspK [Thermodesulfobacteriota bacterium]